MKLSTENNIGRIQIVNNMVLFIRIRFTWNTESMPINTPENPVTTVILVKKLAIAKWRFIERTGSDSDKDSYIERAGKARRAHPNSNTIQITNISVIFVIAF